MNVDFITLAKGIHSGYRAANQMVINQPEQWIDLWPQHTANTEPPLSIPAVDFNHHNIVAVFAGEKLTGGYSVEILNVETKDATPGNPPTLVIQVKYHQPQRGELVTEVVTQPHHLIKIPKVTVNRVVFEQI